MIQSFRNLLSFSVGIVALGGLVLLSSARADDVKSRVFVDCEFRYTTATTCNTLLDSFYSDYEKIISRVNSGSGSDLELRITDETYDSNHVGYTFKWTSHQKGYENSAVSYPLVLVTNLDALSTLDGIARNAAKGLFVYLKIASETISGDALVLTFGIPTPGSASVKNPNLEDKLALSPWVISAGGSGIYNKSGTGEINTKIVQGTGTAEVGYFKDRYKVDLQASDSYTSESISNSQISGTATDAKQKYSGLVVYTLNADPITAEKHKSGAWSVAVLNTFTTDSGSNIASMNTTQAGIEWTLVPFRTTQNHEIAFRVGPEYTSLNLKQPNDLDHLREAYFGAFAKIYYYTVAAHGSLISSVSAGIDRNFKYADRSTVSAAASLSYYVNKSKTIALNGTISRSFAKKETLYYPGPNATPSTNFLQGVFQTGQAGGVATYSVGVSLNLGNSAKKIRDRRWNTN
jgi:hypothetical protein